MVTTEAPLSEALPAAAAAATAAAAEIGFIVGWKFKQGKLDI